MNCSYHPDVPASTACSTCSKDLCPNCAHQIKERYFCQDCLVQGAEMMAKNRRTDDSAEYPKRAAWLSIIPALGAIYNGQYIKAVTHFAVFAALCIMSDDVHEIFGWGALTFYCYMFIDSYRSAQQLREQRLAASTADTPLTSEDVRSPFWGILLILLGIVFTLHNLNIISFFLIRRFWPIVFILVGGYLLYRYTVGRADRKSTLLPF